ncbi:MAG TPA: sialate O-acetylesterase, partial [Allocoleopsis sp.]
ISITALLSLLGAIQANPDIATTLTLPAVISDHMVLQQQTEVAIWGWDKPGTTIQVEFRDAVRSTQAGLDGKWMVYLPSGSAGGAFSLTIQGTSTIVLNDVLVGEVWIAGGQSNMWWSVQNSRDAEQTIAAANTPSIRVWDANTAPRSIGWKALTPQKTVSAEWKLTTPQTVGAFPATAYFFAQELHQALNVPIGILHLAVPGREIEAFLSREFIAAHLPQTLGLEQLQPVYNPLTQDRASDLFNGMVYPTAPYTPRGFLWWQGESNAERALQYRVLFPGLIEEWRHLWQQPDAPFLYVELANFLRPQHQPVEEDPWAALRDAQREALRLPHTAIISTIDILGTDEPDDGHPRNKQLAGHRLALAALAQVYGQSDLVWRSPRFKSVEFEGNRAIVTFDSGGAPLITKDGAALQGFALAGQNQQFFWAEGSIEGDTVILSSPLVEHPVAVRYGWANNPIGNLYNAAELPAFPFRSDTWVLGVKALQFQNMDWQTLASDIDRSLIFPSSSQQEQWQKIDRVLTDHQTEQAISLIESLLQQSIEEETVEKAVRSLLEKLKTS